MIPFVHLFITQMFTEICDVLATPPGMDRQIQRKHPSLQVHCHCLLSDKYVNGMRYGKGVAEMGEGQKGTPGGQ